MPWEPDFDSSKVEKTLPQAEEKSRISRFLKALSEPTIPIESWMKLALPKEEMSSGLEKAAGGALGVGRTAQNLSSPAAIGSIAGIGLLGGQGVLSDIFLGILSGHFGYQAYRDLNNLLC